MQIEEPINCHLFLALQFGCRYDRFFFFSPGTGRIVIEAPWQIARDGSIVLDILM